MKTASKKTGTAITARILQGQAEYNPDARADAHPVIIVPFYDFAKAAIPTFPQECGPFRPFVLKSFSTV